MKKFHLFSFPLIAIGLFVGYAFLVSAAAPSGGYTPGATLDPDCAPGDTDCIVIATGGNSGQWNDFAGGPSLSFSGSGLDDVTLVDDGGYTDNFAMGIVGLAGETKGGISNVSGVLNQGDTVIGNTSGSIAIYQLQTSEAVFLSGATGVFTNGETVTDQQTGGTFTISSPVVISQDWFGYESGQGDGLVAITGSNQVLFGSFTLAFASVSGHTRNDIWEFNSVLPGIYYNSGNVGVGTTVPAYGLDVNGTFSALSQGAGFETSIFSNDQAVGFTRGYTNSAIGKLVLNGSGNFQYESWANGIQNGDPTLRFQATSGGLYLSMDQDGIFEINNQLSSFRNEMNFNAYRNTRDDTIGTNTYSIGGTANDTNLGSANDVNFYGSYSGNQTRTYLVTIDDAGGNFTLGSTVNTKNNGSLDDITFSGTYSGSVTGTFGISTTGGSSYNWSSPDGTEGNGQTIPGAGSTVYLTDGVSVTFGSATYLNKEAWTATVSGSLNPSTTFTWTDGTNGASGVAIVQGPPITLSDDVNVQFGSASYLGGEQWSMDIDSTPNPVTPENFLFTDVEGNLLSAPTASFFLDGLTRTPGNMYAGRTLLGLDAGGSVLADVSGTTFIGSAAGQNATSASNSTFIGWGAGSGAALLANSIFIGKNAGLNDNNNTVGSGLYSILIGNNTSTGGYNNSIAIGNGAINTSSDQFMLADNIIRLRLSGIEYLMPSSQASGSSLLLNDGSGNLSWVAGGTLIGSTSSFGDETWLGYEAGSGVTYSFGSTLIGYRAGKNLNTSGLMTIVGYQAGMDSSASYGVFLGYNAGANISGSGVGSATFLGYNSGNGATNASNSTFIGNGTGAGATNATSSIFVGAGAGANDTVDNTGNSDDFSILLGNYASTGGYENSIALGQYATNTASNQFMIGSSTRPIDEIRVVQTGGTECIIDTSGLGCTSDERFKTNIADLDTDILSKLQDVRTVTYNWKNNSDGTQMVGFLAQNLEPLFPQLVATNERGQKSVYYAQMTPILVEAVKELDLKLSDIEKLADEDNSFGDILRNWFASATNGIHKLFVGEVESDKVKTNELCLDDLCITKDQLQTILNQGNIIPSPNPVPDQVVPEDPGSEGGTEISPEPAPEPEVITPTDTPEPAPAPDPTPETPME